MENNLGNIFVQQRCSDKLETVAPSTEETNSSANNSNYGESVMDYTPQEWEVTCQDMIKEKSTALTSCDRIGQRDCPASHGLPREVNTTLYLKAEMCFRWYRYISLHFSHHESTSSIILQTSHFYSLAQNEYENAERILFSTQSKGEQSDVMHNNGISNSQVFSWLQQINVHQETLLPPGNFCARTNPSHPGFRCHYAMCSKFVL